MYKDHEMPLFWITYSDALRHYVEIKMKDKSAVDDILHEVYLKVFCYCKRFDFSCEKAGVKNLGSWIFRVCHNTMMDHHKKNSRYSYSENLNETVCAVSICSVDTPCSPIEELVRTLPPKYSEAVMLDTVLLLKQAEIAKKLGLTLTAAKSRIQRGKKLLLEKYRQLLEN